MSSPSPPPPSKRRRSRGRGEAGARAPERVLLVHNHYQRPGGEDHVFETEAETLAGYGHAVARLALHNDAADGLSTLALARRTVWSAEGRRLVLEAARRHRADVVHFHNWLPLVSPAGYYGAREAGAAVVQTLHNFRLICPGALLFRDGAVCEACVGKAFAAPGVAHGCYRGSRAATLAVATTVAAHRTMGTWHEAVDRYVAITDFSRAKHVEGGLPPEKIAVKPNALGHMPPLARGGGGYAVLAARLDVGKGIETVARAWRAHPDLPPLVVCGDGPLAHHAAGAARDLGDRFRFVGWQAREDMERIRASADLFVFPSEWHEGGTPMAFVEALAAGLPSVASDVGAVRCMVESGREARLFPPADPDGLAAAVRQTWADADLRARMGREARATFERHHTAAASYRALRQIYADALDERRRTPA